MSLATAVANRIRQALSDPEKYSRWVTVGGHAEGGKQHVGGTPMKIGDGGTVEAGPSALKGQKIGGVESHAEKPHANSKAPWHQTADEFAKSGAKAFRTSQGSLYVHNNGQTIRVKTPHMGHDAKDVGLKQGSVQTHFVDPADAQKVGMWNTLNASGKRIIVKDGHMLLTSINPQTGQRGLDERIAIRSHEPQVGLAPVEMLSKSSQGDGWYSGNHPGNAITEMVDPKEAHGHLVKAAKASGKSVLVQKIADAIQSRMIPHTTPQGNIDFKDHYARRHKSAEGQQEFRWITIGGDSDGKEHHIGGTHVRIRSKTGEIVAGPDTLTGKKVSELGKKPDHSADAGKKVSEKDSKPKRPSGYFKGDRIEYTGKMVDGFHEFEYMEGHKKGQLGVTGTAPDGTNPNDGRSAREWKKQQEEFRRLRDKPEPESTGQESEPKAEDSDANSKSTNRHGQILDHLKTGKHTSLSELRDAIGGDGLEQDLQSLADDDRISMHKPRSGEPGLWMTPEQVKRHEENPPEASDDDSGETEAPTASVPRESRPALDDSNEGDPIPANTNEPRQAADRLFDAEHDSEYAFARKSAVPNFGQDVLGSARHKRNAWRGLADAEANGTAVQQVTRDNLLKNEPHNLMVTADKNPLTSLAMFHALKLFPPKPPKQTVEDRQQYVAEYQNLKATVEGLAKSEIDPNRAVRSVLDHVRNTIQKLRDTHGRGNALANAMCGMQNPLWKSRGRTVTGKMEEFAKALKDRYGSIPQSSTAEAKEFMGKIAKHAQDIIEGVSLPESFGRSEAKGKSKWSPADRYVGKPKRVGGKDVGAVASSGVAASKHLVDAFKMKAVQWGNSVTDKEREHHGRHAVEAFTDLADVLGMKPEDVSLNGAVALAIGSRGVGGSSATYHPVYQVINLNRSGGVGALAHEWGHAFDHSLTEFGTSNDGEKIDASYASETLSRRDAIREHSASGWVKSPAGEAARARFDKAYPPLSDSEKEYAKAFKSLDEAMESSGFNTRLSTELRKLVDDGAMTHDKANKYWKSTREKFARCFERYVQRKLHKADRENTYLTGLSDGGSLWPTDAEADALEPHFEKLFAAHRKAKYGSEEPQRFAREELAEYYAKQLGFNFDEAKHPRDEGGRFSTSEAKSGDGSTAKSKRPEPSAAHKAVASRFGIPPEAVQDIASTDVKELQRRDQYTPPNYAGDSPVTDFEDHPLGTARIMSYGDPDNAYVDFMHEFDPNDLTPTEHEDGVKQRDKSYPKYVEWAKAGHKPPPISAAVSEKTGKYLSMNRRRVLAAQDAGVKSIKGWLGVNNKETGNPLKYGDVMRALKEHEQKSANTEPAQAKPAKPPGVAGMQQGLFGQETSGQKSLFNVVKPGGKKLAPVVAEKIKGKLGELLAKKDTVSPADLGTVVQSESLPGQKSMFGMGEPDHYEKRWITLGKDWQEHRTRVQIDDDGRITAGPAALKGDNIASLGDKSKSAERRAKADHAKASGKTGRDVSTKQAVALGLSNRMLQHQHASKFAKLAGVSTADVLKLMPEARDFINQQNELRERAKDRARKLTGLNAGVLSQIENAHRDYSTVPGFDEAANAVAMEHPELGLDPDDSDTPAAIWELIREGKEDAPTLHSPEVAKLAADWLKASKSGKKVTPKEEFDDSVPFSMSEDEFSKTRMNGSK